MSRFAADLRDCEALLEARRWRPACELLTDRLFRETFDPEESWSNGEGSKLGRLIALCQGLLTRPPEGADGRLMRAVAHVVLEDRAREGGRLSDSPGGSRHGGAAAPPVYEFDRIYDVDAASYEAALRELDACLAESPLEAYAWAWRGRVRTLLGRLRKLDGAELFLGALEDLDRAVELAPRPRFLAWRAQLKRYMEDSGSALADLDRALELEPGLHWAYTEKAEILCDAGRHQEARAVFAAADAMAPKAPSYYAFKGRALARAGFPEEGLAELERALSLEKGYGPGYTWRALVLYLLGRHAEALADLERDLALNPRPALARFWRGRIRLGLGEPAAALADLDEALRLDERQQLARLHRAQALWKLGSYRQAQAELDELYPLDPGSAWQGRLTEGLRPSPGEGRAELERDLRRALAAPAGRAHALGLAGRLKAERGEGEKALPELDAAVALSGGAPWALAWRGLARLGLRRFDAAAADLDAALLLEPGRAWALAWRGKLRLLAGSPSLALPDLDAAAARGLRHPWLFAWRGEALSAEGRQAEALGDLRRSTLFRFRPDNAQAFLSQARVLLALGRRPEASAALARAFELSPELKPRLQGLLAGGPKARWATKAEALARLDAESGAWLRKSWPARQAALAEHEVWLRLLISRHFREFRVPEALAYWDGEAAVLLTRREEGERSRARLSLAQRVELSLLTLVFGWGDASPENRLRGPRGWTLLDFEGVRRSPLKITPEGLSAHAGRAGFLERGDRGRREVFRSAARRWQARLESSSAASELESLLGASGFEAAARAPYLAAVRANAARYPRHLDVFLEAL